MSTSSKCPKCEAETSAEFAYCLECGAQLNASPQEEEATAAAGKEGTSAAAGEEAASIAAAKEEAPAAAANEKKTAAAGKEDATPVVVEEAAAAAGDAKGFAGLSRRLPFKPLYMAIAGVAVLLVVVVAIIAGNAGSSGGGHIIYAKDKELHYAKLADSKSKELTDRLVEDEEISASDFMSIGQAILLSENDRYMFYIDRADDFGVSYYWRDLKNDGKEGVSPVKVDSEIMGLPVLTKNGKLFYKKGDDSRLYVYDRKSEEKTKLDDDVSEFYINEAGDYVVYTTFVDNEYSLYETSLKGINGEKNKIDSFSTIQKAFVEDKKLYYLKDNTLYFKEYGKDKVKIASDVEWVASIVGDNAAYYLKSEEVTNRLNDFINDDLAGSDNTLQEPSFPEYPIQPAFPSEADYKTTVWVDSYWGSERHPETDEWGYWNEETDYEAYNAAYEQYLTKYAEWETEYNRLNDEYTAAYENYEGKQFRDQLREAIGDSDNAVTYSKYSLYYWSNNEEKLVASDLAGYSYNSSSYYIASSEDAPVVIYQKNSLLTSDNQKLSELLAESGSYYISDLISDLQNKVTSARNTTEDVYVAVGDKEVVLESESPRFWRIDVDGSIYFLNDYNYDRGYGVLKKATVAGGVLSGPVTIDEDATGILFGNKNKNLYYFKDVKNGTGDLYSNGKVIATDIFKDSLYNYEGTDTLLYFKDYSDRSLSGTLSMLKGGTESKIADDVSYFAAVDNKHIAYLTDYNHNRETGDLMLYNGSAKPASIDSDVQALLWNASMIWGDYDY